MDNFAPAVVKGNPEAIRAWATKGMNTGARAAELPGVKGRDVPLRPAHMDRVMRFHAVQEMVDEGFNRSKRLWTSIFDVYDECGVRLALEAHLTETAFDCHSTKKLLEALEYRPALGINFDPSHLLWQGVSPALLRESRDRIYHVRMKDVKMNHDGLSGGLGPHIGFGDTRRGWNFVSLGHGDADFDVIIRGFSQMGCHGPLCVEWEDSVAERIYGASEAFDFARRVNFEPSDASFDAALKVK